MLCVTTSTIEGRVISDYCGLVAAEVIEGANILADIAAEWRDGWGGRSATYEKLYAGARRQALDAIMAQADSVGANAILGVRFSYQILGEKNGMLMIAASGTAVVIVQTAEQKRAVAQRAIAERQTDEQRALEEEPAYFLAWNGAERGPFSRNQIRELLSHGTISESTPVRSEGREGESLVSDVIASPQSV